MPNVDEFYGQVVNTNPGRGQVLVTGAAGTLNTTDLTNGKAVWETGDLSAVKTIPIPAPTANAAHPDGMYAITVYAKTLTGGITLTVAITEDVAIGGSDIDSTFASFSTTLATGVTRTEVVQGLRLPAKVTLTPSAAATNHDEAYVRVVQV
jgi:hypothetical protein